AEDSASTIDRLLDRIVQRENTLLETLRTHTPIVETYIQETTGDVARPAKDHYFLGRIQIGSAIEYTPLIERTDSVLKSASWMLFGLGAKNQPMTFQPRGFAQMAFPDLRDFNRQTYSFEFVRREFLGDVRCLVFDVTPIRKTDGGRFVGRIWVEDIDSSIVRSNGTYSSATPSRHSPPARYFQFDSWRVNVAPNQWVPSQIYVEEQGSSVEGRASIPRFKAQTRIWGFAATSSNKWDELTQILIDSGSEVQDRVASKDLSPLESQRFWERQAEENVLTRLEKSGLLAPPGPVDELLNTVVNNLIISANLNVEARCRVLLTTPLETFSIGRTIVLSRGLIDVLPDETSLALVLATELSHIALGHRTPTQFAFRNQTMLTDGEMLQRVHFERTTPELEAAGKKTIEIMRASPYQKTASAGLFLKALSSRRGVLPRLLAPNLGNPLGRMGEFTSSAPELQENELEQIAALPLGSRIKLDPWRDQITLIKTRPLELLSPREKMPFEITPFILYLTRINPN
ncbi:MAG: peptidase Ste24p, partial [Bryobacterales bacterium]|nr:peptidase Ste24p [Bryobacterales bacterium]